MSNTELVISHSHLSVNECCDLLVPGLDRGGREGSSKPERDGEGAPSIENSNRKA